MNAKFSVSLILIIFAVATASYLILLFRHFRFQALKILLAIIFVISGVLIVIETIGQIYAMNHPSYLVFSRAPDKVVGWKSVPNFEYLYTGNHWYSRDYAVQINTNSNGYRDLERTTHKPDNTIRIALLGDSMVEALEVPFDKTAGHLLEKKLNNDLEAFSPNYEVLNFGTGAFGITQSLQTYTEIAKNYNPDYVFIFVSDSHIWRSVGSTYCSTSPSNPPLCYRVRPTAVLDRQVAIRLRNILKFDELHKLVRRLQEFESEGITQFPYSLDEYKVFIEEQQSQITTESLRKISVKLEEAKLHLSPPREFGKFVEAQKTFMNESLNGKRIMKRKRELFVADFFSQLAKQLGNIEQLNNPFIKETKVLSEIYRTTSPDHPILGNPDFPNFEATIFVNLKMLEVLSKKVRQNGGQLIVVDATLNLVRNGQLPAALLTRVFQKFSEVQGILYIPLGERLNTANKKGIETHWDYDWHFNEAGNEIFAEEMHKTLTSLIENEP